MSQEHSKAGAYEMITPPNKLKAKVGSGKGIDAAAIDRAREVIANMAGDFETRAVIEIDQILMLLNKAKRAAQAETAAAANQDYLVDIFRIAHELKGQGGTFGYTLVTKIGGSLCDYIESIADDNSVDAEIVLAHAFALRAVVNNRITGEGGALEKQVISELDRLLKRQEPA